MKSNAEMIRAARPAVLCRYAMAIATLAASTAVADNATPLKPPVGAVEVLSVGTSLVLVVGVILIVGWLYARAQGIRGGNNDAISIVAAQSLGPKERILVVDIAGEQLVLGTTSTQIAVLHVLNGRIEKNPAASVSGGFADRFRDAVRGMGK
jgi:flagellar protein FliO/FliZ